MIYKKPTKAIIAAAGIGTRFLPQTKAMPKEMLPIVDKPVIQYVVEEVVNSGVKDIVIVDSEDAVLVCAKNREQEVRQMVELLKADGDDKWL